MGPRRPLSAGENPGSAALPMPGEDPNALNPRGLRSPNMNVPGAPWYEVPPGGPRFGTGVPSMQFQVTPFDHVVRGHATPWTPGRPMGNTGFGFGKQVGDVSEGAKTGATGLFFLASVAVLFAVYWKR